MAAPYQKALIPGPDKGVAVSDPISMANIIKKSHRVLFVIGANSVKEKVNGKSYAEILLELAVKSNADVIATSSAFKYFIESGHSDGIKNKTLINLIDRLRDPNWTDYAETGEKYDLIVFGGFLIYYLSQMLSTIRNFTEYRTVVLDRYHHPNARFSLPNIEKEDWISYLEKISSNL